MFGPHNDVPVAVVELTEELLKLRRRAEESLSRNGITWSMDYPFTPHVTLNGADVREFFTFTHLRWQ